MPYKWLFITLLAAWVGLFQFLGNSTLGYTKTTSLFGWMEYAYGMSVDDEHGRLVPWVVLGLLWWKRKELVAVPKRIWWPGLLLLCVALMVHVLGYMVQQARISIVGFFLGVYALTGCIWGPRWLVATFFPVCLFAFCVPWASLSEPLTFPLRMLATRITTAISHGVLGIQVIQDGTRIFDPQGAYQYEIAAACSGIRSLTVILGIAVAYAFISFKTPWRRLLIMGLAFPVAVAANVIRLTAIIVAAQAFGQRAGNYVHASWWISLLPYVPAILGILVVGHWLREGRVREVDVPQPVLFQAEQKS